MIRPSKLRPPRLVTILALTLMLGLALPVAALAYELDFLLTPAQPTTAYIKYNTAVDDKLHGNDIHVSFVQGIDTPLNAGDSGELPVTTGRMSFITGSYSGGGSSQWDFGSGGSLTITGTTSYGSGTLLTATFNGAEVNGDGGTFLVVLGSIAVNYIDPTLLSYFGANLADLDSSAFNLLFKTTSIVTPPHTFQSSSKQVFSGDLVVSLVPLPPTLLLLGSGLIGVIALRYRRRYKD